MERSKEARKNKKSRQPIPQNTIIIGMTVMTDDCVCVLSDLT